MFGCDDFIDFDTLETLRQISVAKENASELILGERQTVSHAIYLVNHRLLTEISDIGSSESSSLALYQAFWVAAVLYLYLMIREIPRGASIFFPLTEKLRGLLKHRLTGQPIEGPALELAMWIVFLGATASPAEGDNYFIQLLAFILEHLGLQEEDELRERLKKIIWVDDICNRYLSIMLAEMMAKLRSNTIRATLSDN
jgi:hypothetical protein